MTSNIRFVSPFIFANGFFQINDAVDYESIGIERPTESGIPVRFHIDAVMGWNEDEPGTTYVRLMTGQNFHLDCPIDQFDEFMVAHVSI
jgi:hypothetical protein